jgi:hypothetical protein
LKTCLSGQLCLHSKSCANPVKKAHESAIGCCMSSRVRRLIRKPLVDRPVSKLLIASLFKRDRFHRGGAGYGLVKFAASALGRGREEQ